MPTIDFPSRVVKVLNALSALSGLGSDLERIRRIDVETPSAVDLPSTELPGPAILQEHLWAKLELTPSELEIHAGQVYVYNRDPLWPARVTMMIPFDMHALQDALAELRDEYNQADAAAYEQSNREEA